MSKPNLIATIGLLGVAAGTITGVAFSANAQTANTTNSANTTPTNSESRGPANRNMAKMDNIRTALENKDYEAWKTAIAETRKGDTMLTKIDTQEKFDKLVEMHEAQKSGDTATAEAIREELDLPEKEDLLGKRHEMRTENQAVRTALENKNYEAWKTAVSETRRGEIMLTKIDTQEKFDKLVQMHEALQPGDLDKAKAIAEELGLPIPGRKN